MSKVLVVGLDGATWDIIRPLVAEGRLPTIARLLDKGASGTLYSTTPPVTPAAWTTFFTGKNPGKHGIYDFQRLNHETYELTSVRTEQHREQTLWELLGEAGFRSIILDVPFTYPPRPFNGIMITGYGTPRVSNTTFTHPVDLTEHLPPRLHSEIRVALPSYRFDRSRPFIQEWQEIMRGRQKLLRYMIDEEEWDLFMVVFSITDNMAHVFWTYIDPAHPNYFRPEAEEYREAFLGAYEQGDRILGELMERAGLIDLTPTILHLFDQPIPPDMDGRVLKEIHSDAFLEQRPIRVGDTPATLESAPETLGSGYTTEEAVEIREQLRQLGYID